MISKILDCFVSMLEKNYIHRTNYALTTKLGKRQLVDIIGQTEASSKCQELLKVNVTTYLKLMNSEYRKIL